MTEFLIEKEFERRQCDDSVDRRGGPCAFRQVSRRKKCSYHKIPLVSSVLNVSMNEYLHFHIRFGLTH